MPKTTTRQQVSAFGRGLRIGTWRECPAPSRTGPTCRPRSTSVAATDVRIHPSDWGLLGADHESSTDFEEGSEAGSNSCRSGCYFRCSRRSWCTWSRTRRPGSSAARRRWPPSSAAVSSVRRWQRESIRRFYPSASCNLRNIDLRHGIGILKRSFNHQH